jgi:hypothetical protein
MNSDSYNKKWINKGPTVLNLDNNGQGTHWTSIKRSSDNPKISYYFDSFGVKPPFNLKNQLVFFNPYVYQEDHETNCGARALNFLLNKK